MSIQYNAPLGSHSSYEDQDILDLHPASGTTHYYRSGDEVRTMEYAVTSFSVPADVIVDPGILVNPEYKYSSAGPPQDYTANGNAERR